MKSLFIVEDNAGMRFNLEAILKDEGYQIESFGNTSDFLHRMMLLVPDLILLDIKLPDGDGRQLCDIIKRNPNTHHIFIIMMSAYYTHADVIGDCYADGFLQKPFEIEDLKYIIRNTLE